MTGKLYSQIEHEKLSGQDISVNGVLKKLGLSKSGYYDSVYPKIRNQCLCRVRQPITFFIGSLSTDSGISAVSFLCSLTFFHFKLSGILT